VSEGGVPTPAGPPGRHLELAVLDALRGLAALYVMLCHARWFLWAGYYEYLTSDPPALGRLLAVAFSGLRYGHQAVLLFFVISGVCIHFRQAGALAGAPGAGASRRRSPLDVPAYAWRRARRLYPPLLLALALTAALDAVGARVSPDFYEGLTPYPLLNENLGGRSHSFTTLLGNLLLQPGFAVPAFGTNVPLWSLAFECWFYVLYPVLLLLSLRSGPARATGAVAAVSAVALCASLTGVPLPGWLLSVLTLWIVWAGGAVLADAYVGRVAPRRLGPAAVVAGATLVALALGGPASIGVSDLLSDLLWGVSLVVLLGWLLLTPPRRLRGPIERLGRRLAPLGDVSYSLYLVHAPWLALLSAWWLSSHPRLPLGAELAVPGAASALALAWGCWYLVERHVMASRSRSRLRSRFAPGRLSPRLPIPG
jgi:peptidoglycan/LPS O-acetylase OafA/YrhL